LAKVASGYADNLSSSVLRARNKNVVMSLAMNTDMYNHKLTLDHIGQIRMKELSFYFIEPVSKKLAQGVNGIGALPKTKTIVEFMNKLNKGDV